MNKFFTFCLLLISFQTYTQNLTLELKSGTFELEQKFNFDDLESNPYRIITFEEIPNESQKIELKSHEINFLYYLPTNSYVVSFEKEIQLNYLLQNKVISVNKIVPEYKIDYKLQNQPFPEWSVLDGLLHIKILVHDDVAVNNIRNQINNIAKQIITLNSVGNSITASINFDDLHTVASLPFVYYIEPIDPPPVMENMTGRTLHRTNAINVEYSNGRDYNGEGINIMMHDDGYVEPHIDRKGRVNEQYCSGCSSSSNDSHGDHVSGTIMGAGNLDPQGRGMADGAYLYVLGYSTNNYYQDVPNLYNYNDVVITSASYGNGCNAGYTSLSSDLDQQVTLYPSLLHVFSAGNDGGSNCGYGAGSGWGNITGGHKQAKNVIAVGNLDYSASLASSSSRGPAADGRIKPDICAQGTNVYSTYPNYTYNTISGTSMACPGISGVSAQLYQAYKELNAGTNPPSGLIKCILLNTADDIGNPGPDFKHGWGVVNAFRAIKVIENMNYISNSVTQSSTNTHQINVPQSTKQLKVMVYWHDKEGNTSANISLVNNINMQINAPNGSVYSPFVLNETPNSFYLDQDATTGADNLNNMEQIVIDNPLNGTYDIIINGASIPFGPQDYFISYEFIDDEVSLTYPIGGEGFVPLEYEAIRWDANDNGMLFTLEYSLNNGATWNTIANNIISSQRHYPWQVPNNVTNQAKIRITRGSSVSMSNASFNIISVPSNISVYWPCRDSINISWDPVSGATAYEVSMLGSKYMDSIYTTSNTNVWIINPTLSVSESWFSVSAKYNNGKGRRAVAVNAQAINSNCSGTVLGCTDPSATNFDPVANTTTAYGGALNNTFGSGSYFYGDQHLNFDASKECVIKSALIYSEANNSITFELRNSSGTVIDDTTLNVIAGQQRVDLNFDVPIGNDMQLGVAPGALQTYGLYRNNAGASYPYDIASALNITSSSASTAPYSYYYFYYDIEVETPCQGTGTGTASWDCDGQGNCFDPGTGNGQYASLNQCQSSCITPTWDCDGQGNCFDPGTGNGQYTSLNQCQSSCITPTWDCDGGTCFDPGNGMGLYATLNDCEAACTNVGLEVFNLEGLKIYPNPSSDIFNIEFSSIRKQTLNIRIYNSLGKNILEDHLNDFSGSYNQTFNLKYSAKGVYFLEITTNQGIINKKLILK